MVCLTDTTDDVLAACIASGVEPFEVEISAPSVLK